MSWVLQDVRFALRMLRRRPAFAAIAMVTTGLGIGAATAIYSVVDRALLHPLAFPESSRLVAVYRTYPEWRTREGLSAMWDRVGFSYPHYREWEARQATFASAGGWAQSPMTLTGTGSAEEIVVVRATASLLGVVGVQPLLGRPFLPGDDGPAGRRIALVGHDLWQTRLGGQPDVLGQVLYLDGMAHEIVGVLLPGLDLSGRGRAAPVWVPAGLHPFDRRAGQNQYFVVGRLRSHVTPEQATAETARLAQSGDPTMSIGARLAPWEREITRVVRRPLLTLLGASGVLLVLACVNVATLILGEASGRTAEFAIRGALGAGRLRMGRHLLTESLVLAAGGVLLGTAVAVAGTRALVALAPSSIPQLAAVGVNGRVLAFASALGVLVAISVGLAPMIALTGRSRRGFGPANARGATRRHEGRSLAALVVTQLTLGLALLVGAGLLGKSLRRLTNVDPGFSTGRLLAITLATGGGRYVTEESQQQLYREVTARIASVPGVERAASGSSVPFTGGNSSSTMEIERAAGSGGTVEVNARRSHVMPGFFETLGLRLRTGRVLDAGDRAGGPAVVVVNETTARRFWPGQATLGKRIRFDDTWHTVVGVVEDVRHASLGDSSRVTVYFPVAQQHTPYLMILARIACRDSLKPCDPAALAPAIRQAVAALAPALPVTRIEAMDVLVARSYGGERFRTVLIGTFAVLAVILAAGGTFGVTARAVGRRRREIGIRMALGATADGVAGLFLRRAAGPVVLGIGLGIVVARIAALALAPFLFHVSLADATTYLGAALSLAGVGLLAAWVPARRAARVSPDAVLREDQG